MYDCQQQHITDWATIRSAVKSGLTACLNRRVKRVPMILPVISEI
jgi:ribonuclease J